MNIYDVFYCERRDIIDIRTDCVLQSPANGYYALGYKKGNKSDIIREIYNLVKHGVYNPELNKNVMKCIENNYPEEII